MWLAMGWFGSTVTTTSIPFICLPKLDQSCKDPSMKMITSVIAAVTAKAVNTFRADFLSFSIFGSCSPGIPFSIQRIKSAAVVKGPSRSLALTMSNDNNRTRYETSKINVAKATHRIISMIPMASRVVQNKRNQSESHPEGPPLVYILFHSPPTWGI